MAARKRKVAVGVFRDSAQAQRAVDELVRAGFRQDDVGVVGRNGDKRKAARAGKANGKDKGSKWEEGAATGVAAGAGVGALWALGIAAGVLPVIGPVIAGGLLASVLASAAGGAAVAGLVGALVGLGVPEDEANYYDKEFQAGRTIVTVKAGDRHDEAVAILHRHGAYDMKTAAYEAPAAAAAPTTRRAARTASTTDVAGGRTIELREEELKARKRPVEAGSVRLRKDVVTEQKTLNVPVEREEVVVERRPAAGRRAAAGTIREGEEIRIPVRKEEVTAEKEAVVKEEVRVGKRKVRDTENVTGTVRKEELHVEQEGDTEVRRPNTTGRLR